MGGHTPGPWVATAWEDRYPLDKCGDGTAGPNSYFFIRVGDQSGELTGFITKDDARLMVAAPNLLAALQALLKAVKDEPAMQGRQYVGLGIQVNAALDKALQ